MHRLLWAVRPSSRTHRRFGGISCCITDYLLHIIIYCTAKSNTVSKLELSNWCALWPLAIPFAPIFSLVSRKYDRNMMFCKYEESCPRGNICQIFWVFFCFHLVRSASLFLVLLVVSLFHSFVSFISIRRSGEEEKRKNGIQMLTAANKLSLSEF